MDYQERNNIDQIKIDQIFLKRFTDRLEKQTGIDFNYYRENYIEHRIKFRMLYLKFTDLKSYYNYFLKHPDEIHAFLNKFTVNTSYFFRDREVFETLGLLIIESLKLRNKEKLGKNLEYPIKMTKPFSHEISYINSLTSKIHPAEMKIILQHLSLHKKILAIKRPTLNIWSCPCAAGQEPYSIAMLFDILEKYIPDFPKYKIIGSDVDPGALESANEGIYLAEVLREVPEVLKSKYFKEIKHPLITQFEIFDEIKHKVDFIQEDILTGKHERSIGYDIILCRYFLIYIKRELQVKILQNLQSYLAPGGLLILGNPESIFHMRINLQSIRSGGPIYAETGFQGR